MSLLSKIGKGAAWSAGAQWSIQLMQFGVSIVLARILSPKDYGLVGMSMVFTSFVLLFGNLGLGQALIQRKEINEDYISTAFWATLAAGIFIFIIAMIGAPFVGSFYGEPIVTQIVQVSAIGFVLGAVTSIQISLLTREMAFREIALTDLIASIGSSLSALAAALTGLGVWSLVIGSLVSQFIRIPIFYWFKRWNPKLVFRRTCFRDLFSFGGNILGFNLLNYFNRNLDNLLIGKFLGAAALGYYDLAYQIMLRPISNVSQVISRPLFPALSSVQDDKKAAAETYRSVIIYISLITFPMMLGLAVVAPEFIIGVLGEKWSPAIPVLQILAIVGAMQSIGTTVGDVYQSQGRPDIMLKWSLFATPLIVLAFFVGLNWGIIGVAFAYSIVILILWIIQHSIANRLIELSHHKFWGALFPAIRSASMMVAGLLLIKPVILRFNFGDLISLMILVGSGGLIYFILIIFEKKPEITKIKQLLFSYLWTKRFRKRYTES